MTDLNIVTLRDSLDKATFASASYAHDCNEYIVCVETIVVLGPAVTGSIPPALLLTGRRCLLLTFSNFCF